MFCVCFLLGVLWFQYFFIFKFHSEAGLTTDWETMNIDGFMINFYWKLILSFQKNFFPNLNVYLEISSFLTGSRIQEYHSSILWINIEYGHISPQYLLTHILSKDGQFRIYQHQYQLLLIIHVYLPRILSYKQSNIFTNY